MARTPTRQRDFPIAPSFDEAQALTEVVAKANAITSSVLDVAAATTWH
jgi:hypothetical protein